MAEAGKQATAESLMKMEIIQKEVQRLGEVVEGLSRRSGQIEAIVSVITGIAEQTNLLALNAAIEAARAGEQGRGFAVVAEEVRKLAEQSKEAAKDIAGLILTIQEDIRQAGALMESSKDAVRTGSTTTEQTDTLLLKIADKIKEAAEKVRTITRESQGQKTAAQEAVVLVHGLAAAAEEFASMSQEVSATTESQSMAIASLASATEDLLRISNQLDQLVGRFKF